MEATYQEIEIKKIKPSPFNPREEEAYKGPDFDEMVETIKTGGVIEPIIVRPRKLSKKGEFELVAGERRWRASQKAVKKLDGQKIPAIIRKLNDDQAFEITMIENLHRKDLLPLEEAKAFKSYLDRKGSTKIKALVALTGKGEKYIRKRLAFLNLPADALSAWNKGVVKSGHLEQLARLGDKKEIKRHIQEIEDWGGSITVGRLQDQIEHSLPPLKTALFDLKKVGCDKCEFNSRIQQKDTGVGKLKTPHCLNSNHFKQEQNNYIQTHWEEIKKKHKLITNGFRFGSDIDWNNRRYLARPYKKCKSCKSFVTLVDQDGEIDERQRCIEDDNGKCLTELGRKSSGSGSSGKDPEKAPPERGKWHGEFFREKFYKTRLPERINEVPASDVRYLRILLLALIENNQSYDLSSWFRKKYKIKGDHWYSTIDKYFNVIKKMNQKQLLDEIKDICGRMIMNECSHRARFEVASHLDIDLSKEWVIDREYCEKKEKKVLIEIIEGVFRKDPGKVQRYWSESKNKKGSWKNAKKDELIDILFESGVDLAGIVPKEILTI